MGYPAICFHRPEDVQCLSRRQAATSIMQRRKWAAYNTRTANALALCVLFPGTTFAQETAGAKSGGPETALSLRVDTTLVLIPVAVTDSLNRFVLGLQKEDFHLSEDNVEQNVAHFSG